MRYLVFPLCLLGLIALLSVGFDRQAAPSLAEAPAPQPQIVLGDRSPVDLVLTKDERWLLTANATSSTVSVVEVASGTLREEIPVAERPGDVVLTPDEEWLLVTGTYGGHLEIYPFIDGSVGDRVRIPLGFEPTGIAVTPDSKKAFVGLAAAGEVAVIDLQRRAVTAKIAVSHWPRYLALTPDGKRLAVGCSGSRSVCVIDAEKNELLWEEKFFGINQGHMWTDAAGKYVYFPYMIYRQNPVNEANIQKGWVLGSRIGRVRLDKSEYREAFTLDFRGKAVSDPWGFDATSDEEWLVSSGSGTHELLVYRKGAAQFDSFNGPGDHIEPGLTSPQNHFRIELDGRPMGLAISKDDRHVYVANYLLNCVQVVDLEAREVVRTIELGGAEEPSLARQGEALFYDGRLSLDQWYSCHSCHYEGGSNAVPMDTNNDGSVRTFKTVLPLYDVTETAPWTWHGWQTDLRAAMHKSITDTLRGKPPTEHQVDALLAYLGELKLPPNAHTMFAGGLSADAQRGKELFESEQFGCANCHDGYLLTDGKIHDVGLGSDDDVYEGHNTPSLRGLYRKVRWLHTGRAKSLDDLLTKYHNPENVTGLGALSEAQRQDLIAYLKTL